MIFKQHPSKEELLKFFIYLAIMIALPLLLLIIVLIREIDAINAYLVLLAIYMPLLTIAILVQLRYLEWYIAYEDRIEVRNIYGIKKVVYVKDIKSVKEEKIAMTSRGMYRTFYIFDDGRKDGVLECNSCYNKKKYNLRVYKTKEFEIFVSDRIAIYKESSNLNDLKTNE